MHSEERAKRHQNRRLVEVVNPQLLGFELPDYEEDVQVKRSTRKPMLSQYS